MPNLSCDTMKLFQMLKAVNAINTYIPLVFKPDGIYSTSMDLSQFMCVRMFLPITFFDSYSVDEVMMRGVHGTALLQILSLHKKDTVSMIFENNTIDCTFTSKDGDVVAISTFNTMSLQVEMDDAPTFDFDYRFTMLSSTFTHAIAGMKSAHMDTLTISTRRDDDNNITLQMLAKNEGGNRTIVLPYMTQTSKSEAAESEETYQVDFLNKTKYTTLSKNVDICLSNGLLLGVCYENISFILARQA